jgi:hypothetical protein
MSVLPMSGSGTFFVFNRMTEGSNAKLLSDKKTAYTEYRKLRDEAQELAIAESNLSSLFESEREEQSRQKEKEH